MRQKKIVRIHGGAKSVQLVIGTDDYLTRRSVRNIQAKQEIAKKAKTADPAGYRYFSGFRKYNDRTCPDFSGSVQSDLYHRTFLCNGTCQSHKACHHADRRTVEPLQHQYVRYLRDSGTGTGKLSSDILGVTGYSMKAGLPVKQWGSNVKTHSDRAGGAGDRFDGFFQNRCQKYLYNLWSVGCGRHYIRRKLPEDFLLECEKHHIVVY